VISNERHVVKSICNDKQSTLSLRKGYEMGRQYKLLSSNQKVEQETRGYDESTGTTYTLRAKEDAPDYRYMPDPNLAQTYISPELLASAANEMPETIEQQRNRLTSQYKLPLNDVNILMRIDMEETRGNAHPVAYFEQLCQNRDPKVALNWIIQVLLRALNDQEKTFAENTISEEHFGQLIDLVEAGQVTASTARSLIKELLSNESLLQQESSQPNPVLSLLSSRDALALSGQDELTSLCQQIIKDLPKESDKVRQGNDKVVMRLVGEVMKRARGRADAQLARKIFTNLLRE
jgi:aspartyl-tRNA(Asn)/glutamyl-tRNA(Gln) amidotransferase subunit B